MFNDSDASIVHFVVNPSSGKLRVMSPSISEGEIKDDLWIQKAKGDDIVFSVNAKYFQDVLSNTSSEYVTISIKDSKSPILISPQSDFSKNIDLVLPCLTNKKIETTIEDFDPGDSLISSQKIRP